MASVPDIRPLTSEERELLEWLLQHGTSEACALLDQSPNVSVVSRCGCGCPTIELAVAGRAASLGSPTTILAEAGGVSPEGVRVGIILHGRGGLISELEIYSPAGHSGQFSLPHIRDIEPF